MPIFDLRKVSNIYTKLKPVFVKPINASDITDFESYFKASYNIFMNYVQNIAKHHVYMASGYMQDGIYRKVLDYYPEFKLYFSQMEQFGLVERKFLDMVKSDLRRAFWQLPTRRRVGVEGNPLSMNLRYGDESGFHIHKWTLHHYSN